MKKLVILLSMILVSCGKEKVEYVNLPAEAPKEAEQSEQDLVNELVQEKNEYRDALGQAPLSEGLTCTLHNAANADLDVSFGSTAYTFSMHTEFNQPNISGSESSNILPQFLRSLYVGLNYSLRCQGQLVVLDSQRHEFELESDDGSRLWVNGTMVIDNEGNHAMTKKKGVIVLERGVYSFRLDYSQSGGGNQGLILKQNDKLLTSNLFYR